VRISLPFPNPGAGFLRTAAKAARKFPTFKNALVVTSVVEISGLDCDENSEGTWLQMVEERPRKNRGFRSFAVSTAAVSGLA
jgi:hypothetical protein